MQIAPTLWSLRGVIHTPRADRCAWEGDARDAGVKHRLVEFLVAELRFSVFAIEANWPECEEINDYVVTDRSNLASFEFGVPLHSCSGPDPGFGMID